MKDKNKEKKQNKSEYKFIIITLIVCFFLTVLLSFIFKDFKVNTIEDQINCSDLLSSPDELKNIMCLSTPGVLRELIINKSQNLYNWCLKWKP